MSAPQLSVIAERALKYAWDVDTLPWAAGVEHDKLFFPEGFTALSFTSSFALLNEEERRQYNQWYAMGVSEQFIFLEQDALTGVVSGLLRVPGLIPTPMRPLLEQFVEEEDKHTETFRRLLRLAWPEVYAERDYHFFTPGALSVQIARLVQRVPQHFVAWPFLALALEEKTIAFYRAYERASAAGEDDKICGLHRAVHRYHMLDETRHVHLDEHLIDVLWEPAPRWLRAVNTRLLMRTLTKYTNPRRRSLNVNIVRALVDKYPRLEPHREQMIAEIRALKGNASYQDHINGRDAMPRTFAAFDRYPEFRTMTQAAPAYRPRGV